MELILALLAIIGVIVVIPLFAILNGYIIQQLWSWFIVPLSMPEISLAHAIGLAVVVGHFTKTDIKKHDSKEEKIQAIAVGLLKPLFTLLIGYIAHSFMR